MIRSVGCGQVGKLDAQLLCILGVASQGLSDQKPVQHIKANVPVSDTSGLGAPTVVRFTVPMVPRFRSESKGAYSRRCSGSVSARQTFTGG